VWQWLRRIGSAMTEDREVVIVGGGIGGLTAALELQRAGFRVRVYERRDELAEVDTGFLLWSFAIKRLRALGLGEGLERIGQPLTRLVHKSWRGDLLSELSLKALNKRVGAASYDVHRAGLQRVLADAVGDETIYLGERCIAVAEEQGQAIAVFAGNSTSRGDLLLGVDGVNSVVRRRVAGDVSPQWDDIAIWRGIAEIGRDVIPDGDHIRVLGPGALFGVGRLDERVVRWYAGALFPVDREPGQDEIRNRAEALFADWSEPTPTVISATEPDAFLYNDAPRAKPLSAWSRGHIALLGDAAHPILPTLAMGGGMAIEDAGVLRESLEANADGRIAFSTYARRRRKVATRIQLGSIAFAGVLGMRRRLMLRTRDAGFRIEWPQSKAIERLMRGGV
jgi:2-polyprenyl-6-methoxyphenol hydroxylase-like FAD-dependent oxidoreductase